MRIVIFLFFLKKVALLLINCPFNGLKKKRYSTALKDVWSYSYRSNQIFYGSPIIPIKMLCYDSLNNLKAAWKDLTLLMIPFSFLLTIVIFCVKFSLLK